ncbi:hypothetical protein MUN76_02765 [Leucobacter rhizosphaerae]|uniref:Cardiolipin synthase N-terminal domain-containing protein n=1 Tax=Leucobacter rhizosphaerae TaxID=2932245 RepID=A0ABY4FXC4_9MICO|nr:hypothetical protein [Leucobacter rhizosphaerae]UOQ60917.1 hypothetical protein MUN76_02765 [Leucobacter rhizosphaerae]
MFPTFEVVWTILFVVHFGLALLAILSLSKLAPGLSAATCARWALFCILVPVVGSICWFRIGRPKLAARTTDDETQ